MRYQTKHEWAAAKAEEMRKQALNTTWAMSRSRQRANANHYAYYDREALRYERMAERFRAQGL